MTDSIFALAASLGPDVALTFPSGNGRAGVSQRPGAVPIPRMPEPPGPPRFDGDGPPRPGQPGPPPRPQPTGPVPHPPPPISA